jgi:DNA-binding GntR family transcriptional regulator
MDALTGVKAGPSITEQVYLALRALVLNGGHRPGARLSEVGLAQRLEVSRGPVREALERLAQEGLVVRVPRRGTFVRTYGRAEVRELMELRRILESSAARLAVRRAGKADLLAMEELLTAADAAIAQGRGYPADKDFHHGITRLAGNRELERFAGRVYDQLRLARALAARRPGRSREAWREHAAILRALLARDEAAVQTALDRHLGAAEATMLALVEQTRVTNERPKRGEAPVLPKGRSQ